MFDFNKQNIYDEICQIKKSGLFIEKIKEDKI